MLTTSTSDPSTFNLPDDILDHLLKQYIFDSDLLDPVVLRDCLWETAYALNAQVKPILTRRAALRGVCRSWKRYLDAQVYKIGGLEHLKDGMSSRTRRRVIDELTVTAKDGISGSLTYMLRNVYTIRVQDRPWRNGRRSGSLLVVGSFALLTLNLSVCDTSTSCLSIVSLIAPHIVALIIRSDSEGSRSPRATLEKEPILFPHLRVLHYKNRSIYLHSLGRPGYHFPNLAHFFYTESSGVNHEDFIRATVGQKLQTLRLHSTAHVIWASTSLWGHCPNVATILPSPTYRLQHLPPVLSTEPYGVIPLLKLRMVVLNEDIPRCPDLSPLLSYVMRPVERSFYPFIHMTCHSWEAIHALANETRERFKLGKLPIPMYDKEKMHWQPVSYLELQGAVWRNTVNQGSIIDKHLEFNTIPFQPTTKAD